MIIKGIRINITHTNQNNINIMRLMICTFTIILAITYKYEIVLYDL